LTCPATDLARKRPDEIARDAVRSTFRFGSTMVNVPRVDLSEKRQSAMFEVS